MMRAGRKTRSSHEVEVAVVGAGITGLVLGRELAKRGRDVLVLESEDRPGGVIRSRRVDGRLLELGPQRTRLTPPVADLVRELGLESELVTADRRLPLYVVRDGRLRLAPLGPAEFLRTDLLSPGGKLRLLAEPLTAPPRPEESVAEALSRRYGSEAYRHLLGPLFGGIYASDPARMPAAHSLIPLRRALGNGGSFVWSAAMRRLSSGERPPAASFRRGLATLTEALAGQLGERLLLGTPVEALEPAEDGVGVRIGDSHLRARSVVLTVPAPAAARLLRAWAEPRLDRLADLTYNRLAVVHLSSALEERGYGYQISLGEEGYATRGVTWNASLFDRDGVYTAYVGGMGREDDVGRPDEWLAETAAREFERVTGAAARPISVSRTRIPARDATWRVLEEARRAVPARVHLCANWESPAGIPWRVREARSLAECLDGSLVLRRPPREAAAAG